MILYSYPATVAGRNAWAFDHENDHANLASGMTDSNGLTGALYYFLDPMVGSETPNGSWSQLHQQAHDDAGAYYGVSPSLPLGAETPGTSEWWLFTNAWEHVALNEALLQSQG